MNFLGKKLYLQGRTPKGKNRIKKYGSDWTVLASTDHVLFNPDKKGTWLFVVPTSKNQDDIAAQWIHAIDDPNYQILS